MAEQQNATLYLRGVPQRLVREAKAEAARRGTTLTALVKDAVERFLTTEKTAAPDVLEPIEDDLAWYEANKRRLLRRYAGQYVAIIDLKVVDHDKDFDALAKRVFSRFGVRSIAMPKVTLGERVVHVPSPRVVR